MQPQQTYIIIYLILSLLLTTHCQSQPPTPPLPTATPTEAIEIAVLSPMSGELLTFGRLMRQGSRLAIDDWLDRGGLLGQHITWRLYDSQCDFEAGQQAAQQAIDDGHRLIIGPLCSEAAIGAALAAEAAGVVLMTPTATHPLVTVDGQGNVRKTVFRIAPNHSWPGQVMAYFGQHTLTKNRAALLVQPSDDYAVKLTTAFAEQFTADGGDIVYRATYQPAELDFSQHLTAIHQAQADLIYLPADPSVSHRVGQQLNDLAPEIILLGSDQWHHDELNRTMLADSYFSLPVTPAAIEPTWAERYKSLYAIEADTLAVLGYEATDILLSAIAEANSLEPVAISQALEGGHFNGLIGPITFAATHDPIRPLAIMAIETNQISLAEVIHPKIIDSQ